MTATNLKPIAKQAIGLMDLTSLTNTETDEDIILLCTQAKSAFGNTAAICIYPRFIPFAKKILKQQGSSDIKIATVTNFPHGNDDIDIAVAETKAAVAYGADEVDVVFPYRSLISGNSQVGFDLVSACKSVCPDSVLLKVIIETGELKSDALIVKASEIAINAGADFIKTSTGKVPVNATPKAAQLMLEVIKNTNNTIRSTGFKAAGGVRDAQDANVYLEIAKNELGDNGVTANTFRFGASSLLNNLLSTLSNDKTVDNNQNNY